MKKTHKFRALGNVSAIVAASGTITEAAKRLGVSRNSLHRWRREGKLPGPVRRESAPGLDPSSTDPQSWREALLARYTFSDTERQLVKLADLARQMADDLDLRPAVRLSAMARYQQLVRHLRLDTGEPAATVTAPTMNPARVARTSGDPRNILMAVK